MSPKKIELLEKFMDDKFRPAVTQCLLGQMAHIQEAIETSPESGVIIKFECRLLFSGKSPEGKLKFTVAPFVKPSRDSVEMTPEDPDQVPLPLGGESAAEGVEDTTPPNGVPEPEPDADSDGEADTGKKGKKKKK